MSILTCGVTFDLLPLQESLPTEAGEAAGVGWEAAEETAADRDGVSDCHPPPPPVAPKLLDRVTQNG